MLQVCIVQCMEFAYSSNSSCFRMYVLLLYAVNFTNSFIPMVCFHLENDGMKNWMHKLACCCCTLYRKKGKLENSKYNRLLGSSDYTRQTKCRVAIFLLKHTSTFSWQFQKFTSHRLLTTTYHRNYYRQLALTQSKRYIPTRARHITYHVFLYVIKWLVE